VLNGTYGTADPHSAGCHCSCCSVQGAHWDISLFGRPHVSARASSFLIPAIPGRSSTSFDDDDPAEGGIDQPPDQQIYPLPMEGLREKDLFGKIQGLLTGHKAPPVVDTFGKDAKELDPSIKDTHEHANKADEYAAEAQEAAEEAISWDRGIVQNVNVADEAWDGAMYAKKVEKALAKAVKDVDAIAPSRPPIAREIGLLGKRLERVIDRPGQIFELNGPLNSVSSAVLRAGRVLDPIRKNSVKPLLKFLEDEDHPNLFPPESGPGMKDGHVDVPLHFPDQPDPMLM